jgi:hypothetical protein
VERFTVYTAQRSKKGNGIGVDNIISTGGSVKHNTNIVLKYTLGLATCFGLSKGHLQAIR